MEQTTAIIIASIGVAALAVIFVVATSLRRERKRVDTVLANEDTVGEVGGEEAKATEAEAALVRRESSAVAKTEAPLPVIPDEEAIGVTRRQFFNRSIVAAFGLGLAAFGGATIAFLWPKPSGGFGGKINIGKRDEILATIEETKEPYYVPDGRLYINPYPPEDVKKAAKVYSGSVLGGMEEGVVALYQKCVHLGCRVPWCKTSQWFECPCHGSQYNRVGEKKAGPAPRGLDHFGLVVEGGAIVVDTGQVVQGAPIGVDTTGQEAEGPHCV